MGGYNKIKLITTKPLLVLRRNFPIWIGRQDHLPSLQLWSGGEKIRQLIIPPLHPCGDSGSICMAIEKTKEDIFKYRYFKLLSHYERHCKLEAES